MYRLHTQLIPSGQVGIYNQFKPNLNHNLLPTLAQKELMNAIDIIVDVAEYLADNNTLFAIAKGSI